MAFSAMGIVYLKLNRLLFLVFLIAPAIFSTLPPAMVDTGNPTPSHRSY